MPDAPAEPVKPQAPSSPNYAAMAPDQRDGNDALCFTPGFPGATFSAGTIHAYLAADREPPKVVAGISLGTLSAAVLQRSYADLTEAKKNPQTENVEASRWKFFRKYLATITNRPFQVLWNGIPDPADFFAELPPIKDPVPETITDPELRKNWKAEELASRRELYLLVKLGHWLARLPVRVSAVANTVVNYVRAHENYPSPKIVRSLEYFVWLISVVVSLILHVVRVPDRFPNYKFSAWREQPGLPPWLIQYAIALTSVMAALAAGAIWILYQASGLPHSWWAHALYLLIAATSVVVTNLCPTLWRFAANKLLFAIPALLCSAASISLIVFLIAHFPAQDPSVPSQVVAAVVFAVYLAFLITLSLNPGLAFKIGFHICSGAGWLFQRPLFGYRVWSFSALALAVLFVFAANLSGIFLYLIQSQNQWLVALSAVIAVISLFFAASLGTYWIPMKGKFPFRVVPLVCSIAFVSAVTFRAEGWGPQFRSWLMTYESTKGLQSLLYQLCGYVDKSALLTLPRDHAMPFSFSVLGVLVLLLSAAAFLFGEERRNRVIKHVLKKVAMEKHMVHDYHLKYALTTLFGENADSPPLTNYPFPVVLVATPLQTIGFQPTLNNQLWANAAARPKIVDVLRATLAVPAVLDPFPVEGQDVDIWYKGPKREERLDLVDAAIVRQNPLPAFFNFIRRNYVDNHKTPDKAIAASLASDGPAHARVHVVYNVPAQPPGADQSQRKLENILDVAFLSLRLAKRRDINLEIDQTNFIARLAHSINSLNSKVRPPFSNELKPPEDPIFPIFADHIAPITDLSFENPIAPKREEVLKHAAAGCKTTLQQLYSIQIRQVGPEGVECPEFLAALRRQKDPNFNGPAGLPEICQHCDKHLVAAQDSGRKAVFDDQEMRSWRERTDLHDAFPQLRGDQPRIVFVASGGVFRGPFHAGMVNAMLAVDVKPDLIVGASVGTLVGAALGATLAAPNRDSSLQVLGALVQAFQKSDDQIAFTKTLKNAARELGIRGRNVDLAPYELRKKILEGTKSDPGFAVTGTPPILIDAISELLLLPHSNTKRIASQFVAGHFTEATRCLLTGIRRETLRRLDIVDAVMGASLLEPTARRLLGSMLGYNMNSSQPYQQGGIAIFGTSTCLNHQQPVLLGRYKWETNTYDFVNACLASSAFPAVFAPRHEDEIFPGMGDPDNIYSDGGMFDNLPISPALEILTASQRQWIRQSPNISVPELGRRVANPDLFITGSLDITASPKQKEFDNLVAIRNRAGTLQNNVKIKAFQEVSESISKHLGFLHQVVGAYLASGNTKLDCVYLDGLVNAALLPVYPTDANHLNGTFQFCNSLGRKLEVINASMADGCFRTLKKFSKCVSPSVITFCSATVKNLAAQNRVPVLAASTEKKLMVEKNPQGPGHYCPYFRKTDNGVFTKFLCPFSENPDSVTVFQSCVKDQNHIDQHKELVKMQAAPAPIPPPVTAAKAGGQGGGPGT